MDQWVRPTQLIPVYPHEAMRFNLITVSPQGRQPSESDAKTPFNNEQASTALMLATVLLLV